MKQSTIFRQLPVGRVMPTVTPAILMLVCLCGCEGFRYAATEAQKQNAFLHRQVCTTAADLAADENASPALCGLTDMAAAQSAAFVSDYGLPETPADLSALADLESENPLPPSGYSPLAGGEFEQVLMQAQTDSARRPDVWTLADSAIQLGIALAGLAGGVYGVRVAAWLKTARDKSKALREIVEGNELFKQLYPEQADRFKDAQQKQSPATRQLVTAVKAQ